jgi:H+-transporting ATPase
MFTLLIVRERGLFWNSAPSRTLLVAMIADMMAVAVLVTIGIPGVTPIPPTYLAVVFTYVLGLSLVVNDRVKHLLMGQFGMAT